MYTVQAGDTLPKIAQQHNVRVEAILRWNSGIRNPDKLSVGQRLMIPPATLDFRALSNGKGHNRHILDALRQGGVMFSTSFYPAYAQAMAYACTMFSCRSFDRERFHDAYKEEFKGDVIKQEHIDGLNKLLGFIEHDPDMTNLKVAAYLLATIHHETSWPKTNERYAPITERGNGGKEYFNKYDPELAETQDLRDVAKANGNTVKGDGYKYRGRGYIQLTWKDNYQRCARKFGRDLVNNPDLALEPQLSYSIASFGMRTGLFTGKKIESYIYGSIADYVNARRVINKLDKAEEIAAFANKFECILARSIEG